MQKDEAIKRCFLETRPQSDSADTQKPTAAYDSKAGELDVLPHGKGEEIHTVATRAQSAEHVVNRDRSAA